MQRHWKFDHWWGDARPRFFPASVRENRYPYRRLRVYPAVEGMQVIYQGNRTLGSAKLACDRNIHSRKSREHVSSFSDMLSAFSLASPFVDRQATEEVFDGRIDSR